MIKYKLSTEIVIFAKKKRQRLL